MPSAGEAAPDCALGPLFVFDGATDPALEGATDPALDCARKEDCLEIRWIRLPLDLGTPPSGTRVVPAMVMRGMSGYGGHK